MLVLRMYFSVEVSFLHTSKFCFKFVLVFVLCFRFLWLCEPLQSIAQSYLSIDMSRFMMKWTWQNIEPKPFTLGSMIYKLHTHLFFYVLICMQLKGWNQQVQHLL